MSKGLEALESLRQECNATYFDEKGKQWWTTDKKSDYRCNIIETALKALEIIKVKGLSINDIAFIKNGESWETYVKTMKQLYWGDEHLDKVLKTKEEYELLKEVLL